MTDNGNELAGLDFSDMLESASVSRSGVK